MHLAVNDSAFTDTLREWLRTRSELFVMLRYANAGGARDYEFHSSLELIAHRLASVPAQTSVIVFREPQLPIRGIVDGRLIATALASIPDGVEFLLVESTPTKAGNRTWHHSSSGESHAELRDDLQKSLGRHVVLGKYPPWLHDGPDVISGYVPDQSGRIRPGAY